MGQPHALLGECATDLFEKRPSLVLHRLEVERNHRPARVRQRLGDPLDVRKVGGCSEQILWRPHPVLPQVQEGMKQIGQERLPRVVATRDHREAAELQRRVLDRPDVREPEGGRTGEVADRAKIVFRCVRADHPVWSCRGRGWPRIRRLRSANWRAAVGYQGAMSAGCSLDAWGRPGLVEVAARPGAPVTV